jgi:hypothetical protein
MLYSTFIVLSLLYYFRFLVFSRSLLADLVRSPALVHKADSGGCIFAWRILKVPVQRRSIVQCVTGALLLVTKRCPSLNLTKLSVSGLL